MARLFFFKHFNTLSTFITNSSQKIEEKILWKLRTVPFVLEKSSVKLKQIAATNFVSNAFSNGFLRASMIMKKSIVQYADKSSKLES
jgi:hypothetical protein